MNKGSRIKEAEKMFLFVMLVICTLLHGLSVAPAYIPAIKRAFFAVKSVIG